jgi:hypothetical protein
MIGDKPHPCFGWIGFEWLTLVVGPRCEKGPLLNPGAMIGDELMFVVGPCCEKEPLLNPGAMVGDEPHLCFGWIDLEWLRLVVGPCCEKGPLLNPGAMIGGEPHGRIGIEWLTLLVGPCPSLQARPNTVAKKSTMASFASIELCCV